MATSTIKQTMNESNSSYCKMPDGTLIQWGALSIAGNATFGRHGYVFDLPCGSRRERG